MTRGRGRGMKPRLGIFLSERPNCWGSRAHGSLAGGFRGLDPTIPNNVLSLNLETAFRWLAPCAECADVG